MKSNRKHSVGGGSCVENLEPRWLFSGSAALYSVAWMPAMAQAAAENGATIALPHSGKTAAPSVSASSRTAHPNVHKPKAAPTGGWSAAPPANFPPAVNLPPYTPPANVPIDSSILRPLPTPTNTTVVNSPVATVNVRHFGAVGDGVTDDTAAIQAAINSLGGAGIVYIPSGLYRITRLDLRGHSVTLQGDGWGMSNGAPIGDPQWSNFSTTFGTRLLCTATTGSAIDLPIYYAVNYGLSDLALIGTGAASTSALTIHWQTRIDNVLVANFDTGVTLQDQAYDMSVNLLDIRGCNTGLSLNGVNNDSFESLHISWCKVRAIQMVYSLGNTFQTPLIEDNQANIEILLTDDGNPLHGCKGNDFVNIWSENPGNPQGYILDLSTSSSDNVFAPLQLHSGNADEILVLGPRNTFGPIISDGGGSGTLTAGPSAVGTVEIGANLEPAIGPGAGLVDQRTHS